MADKISPEEMAGQLGFSKAFFYSDPELKRLITAAVKGQWSSTKFQGRFMNTKWYRRRSASVRQWTDLIIRDPGEAKAKIGSRWQEIADMAHQLGLNVSSATVTKMAKQSLMFSWTETETKNVLAEMVKYVPGKMGGTPATLEMQFKQMANEYGIVATDAQIGGWIKGILSERYTDDNIKDFLRDSAKSRYVGMGALLDQGFTVKDAASNHLSSYARLLEVDAETVDMMDPIIQKALQGTPNAKGVPEMQTVYDFERSLKKDPRWLKTKNAKDDMTNAAMGIARDWGLVG